MKITRFSIVAVALCSALLIPQFALAQAQKDPNEVDDYMPLGNGIPIPDDGYDGTLASMVCLDTVVPDGTVAAINVDLAVDHTWIGDLTVKVVPPGGTDADALTLMSRPGFDEGIDDGSGCCGDSSNMNSTPINFADANSIDAEMMGANIDGDMFVCQDDGECDFFPNPDSGPGTNLAQFIGQPAGGTWQVCVGDSVSADAGTLDQGTVNISLGVPTTNRFGLLLLLGLLAGGSLLVMRRKASVG